MAPIAMINFSPRRRDNPMSPFAVRTMYRMSPVRAARLIASPKGKEIILTVELRRSESGAARMRRPFQNLIIGLWPTSRVSLHPLRSAPCRMMSDSLNPTLVNSASYSKVPVRGMAIFLFFVIFICSLLITCARRFLTQLIQAPVERYQLEAFRIQLRRQLRLLLCESLFPSLQLVDFAAYFLQFTLRHHSGFHLFFRLLKRPVHFHLPGFR